MGMRPVPRALKVLRGNPGKRPLNDEEPQPETGIPPAPKHFSKASREEWDRITVELEKLGLLTHIDRGALSIYCTAWGRHVEAENHLRAEGLMLIGKPRRKVSADGTVEETEGGPYQNPWMAISNRAIETMHSMLGEFGLSPSTRSRMSVKPPKGKKESLFG